MGAQESKLKSELLHAILEGREGKVATFLKNYPDYVNTSLCNETTNPICRATYLGNKNIVNLILKFGGDVNLRSTHKRTPIMWASFRDNTKMMEFLLEHGADVSLEDENGFNCLDLAITRLNY